MRRAVLEANPESAVVKVKTLDEARSEAVASPRTTAQLFGLFAALALVIAVAGIGSMLALWVRQRIREIGIRMALGAAPADILSTVLRQGMLLAHYCWPAGFPRAVPRGSIRKSRCAANKIHISPSELKS